MKKFLLILLISGIPFIAFSQEFVWKAGINSFFDNAEFANSNVQIPQTMAGTRLTSEAGISWLEKHRIFAGIDMLREFGSDKIVDFIDPIAYYNFDGEYFRFYMGTFPRKMVLEKYPRMFFQDSIANYRSILNGLFWEYHKKNDYINVWLDWTSRQTEERRETFFMGWSGRYNLNVFYAQHFGYMFHFAKRKHAIVLDNLHDNGLILTSLGIDFSTKTNFEKLEANIGWAASLERNRGGNNEWQTPQGILSEIKVEYKGLGLFNTLYRGGKQQIFYEEHGNALYWGDRFYRAKAYNRADFYINFFKTDVVNLKLTFSLHWAEQAVYNQQSLYASFNLDNLKKRKQAKKYEYIWDSWFKKQTKT